METAGPRRVALALGGVAIRQCVQCAVYTPCKGGEGEAPSSADLGLRGDTNSAPKISGV